MDGSADNRKRSGNDLDDGFGTEWEPAGLGRPAFKAIDGKPLTNAFDADLGFGLDFPPLAPDSAWHNRSATFGRIGGIMAIVLLEIVSLSVRPAGHERVAEKTNVAIAGRNKGDGTNKWWQGNVTSVAASQYCPSSNINSFRPLFSFTKGNVG